MPTWRSLWFRRLLVAAIVAAPVGLAALRPIGVQALDADMTVSIDRDQPVGVSQYATGLTHIDSSLIWADAGAIESAKAVVAQSISFQNSHLMAWGASDPWPDPSQPTPTNWNSLDRRMDLALETGATPIITLAQAPWWMKGQRQADGTTKLIPSVDGDFQPVTYAAAFTDYRGLTYPAGYVSPSPYDARILDNHMDEWLRLVQATAERYMAPPYNVRYFQVWNELKGYYNPSINRWDHTTGAGDPSGYNAQHGYTYMYNQVYARLKQVARNLGIAESDLKIGGPYVAFKTWANPGAGGYPATEPQLQNRPYGTFDQRDIDAIKYWLQHKVGAEFIAWDGGTKNREGLNLVDPYAASERFGDTVAWLRSLDPALYPGADTLPVAYAEWYAFPYDTTDPQQHNAVKTYAALRYIQAGGWLTLLWGGEARSDPHLDPSLYTETANAGGGQALPWAASYQALKEHFGAGTVLVHTAQSSPDIGVLASALKTLLVNKTAASVIVAVNSVLITLDPYQVVVLDTPPLPASATPTAMSPTSTATDTALPAASATPTAMPPTSTATDTALPTASASPTAMATHTASPAATHTATTLPAASATQTASPTASQPPTTAPSASPTPTRTPKRSNTATQPASPTAAATATPPLTGDVLPPAVAISSPRDGSRVASNVTLTIAATATDNVAVSAVKFFVNETLVCTDSAAPYTCAWPVPAPKGVVYTVRVQALDPSGNQASRSVQVTSR